jgi:hypothetical protein
MEFTHVESPAILPDTPWQQGNQAEAAVSEPSFAENQF